MNTVMILAVAAGFVVTAMASYADVGSAVRRIEARLVLPVALLSAAASAVVVRTQSTAFAAADLVWVAATVACLTWAASKARRSALVVATGIWAVPAILEGVNPQNLWSTAVVCGVPFGLAIALRVAPRRQRLVQLAGAPLVAFSPFYLPTSLPTRVPSALGVVGAVILVVSATKYLKTSTRKRVVGVAFLGILVTVGVSAFGVLAAFGSRTSAQQAVEKLQAGLSSAQSLDGASASESLSQAAEGIETAGASLRGPFTYPAHAIPILGRNLQAVTELADTVVGLAKSGSSLALIADVGQLRPINGSVNLEAMEQIRSGAAGLRGPLESFQAVEQRVRVDPWVAGALQSRLRAIQPDLTKANSNLVAVEKALAVLPDMLGASGPRRYLVLIGNPAEARGSGGVIGNYAEITAVDGRLSLTRFGRNAELQTGGLPLTRRFLDAPSDFIARYAAFGAGSVWSNINMSPQFSSVGMAAANHYPQSGGRKVDGVISVDPVALQAAIALTSPITVAGWDQPLDGSNTAEVLMHLAYVEKGGSSPERLALLATVAQASWAQLTSSALPGPQQLGQTMGPIVRDRHLQMWMRNTAEQQYIESISAAGLLPEGSGLVLNNASANKIEWFLDTAGALTQTAESDVVTFTLTNRAPSSGLPDYVIGNQVTDVQLSKGGSRLFVSFYSSQLPLKVLQDGVEMSIYPEKEAGREVVGAWVNINSGQTTKLEFVMAKSSQKLEPWILPKIRP